MFGIFMAHAKNGFCIGLLFFFLNILKVTLRLLHLLIYRSRFLDLGKKTQFPNVVSDWSPGSGVDVSGTLLMTLRCIQISPIILNVRNTDTQLTWNPNEGTKFLPFARIKSALPALHVTRHWTQTLSRWHSGTADHPFLSVAISKDFLFCWKSPCQVSSFQSNYRWEEIYCIVMLKALTNKVTKKNLNKINMYTCIIS